MSGENEGCEVQEFDEVAAAASGLAMARVLTAVAAARSTQDIQHGYFRDYADTDSSAGALWSHARQVEAESQARQGKRPWVSQLFVTVGLVALLLDPRNPYAGRAPKLRAALLQVAELSVAWVEALDAREAEQRTARMARPPWWMRVRNWWRNRP